MAGWVYRKPLSLLSESCLVESVVVWSHLSGPAQLCDTCMHVCARVGRMHVTALWVLVAIGRAEGAEV